jgi:hypothetical protein
MARLAPTLDLGVVDFLRSEHMEDRESLLAVLQLVHQNQVALAESVQLISSWCLSSGLSEVTLALQPRCSNWSRTSGRSTNSWAG